MEFNLTREKAINMILWSESRIELNFEIDCSDIDESKLQNLFDCDLEYEITVFREKCLKHIEKIREERKKNDKLPTHEILEMGERMGLWQLKERQKRLVIKK